MGAASEASRTIIAVGSLASSAEGITSTTQSIYFVEEESVRARVHTLVPLGKQSARTGDAISTRGTSASRTLLCTRFTDAKSSKGSVIARSTAFTTNMEKQGRSTRETIGGRRTLACVISGGKA